MNSNYSMSALLLIWVFISLPAIAQQVEIESIQVNQLHVDDHSLKSMSLKSLMSADDLLVVKQEGDHNQLNWAEIADPELASEIEGVVYQNSAMQPVEWNELQIIANSQADTGFMILQNTGESGSNVLNIAGVGSNGNQVFLEQRTQGNAVNTADLTQEGDNNLLSGVDMVNGELELGAGPAQQISQMGNNSLTLYQNGSDSAYLYQSGVSHNTAVIDQSGFAGDTAIIYQQGNGINTAFVSQTGYGQNFAQVAQTGHNNYVSIQQ